MFNDIIIQQLNNFSRNFYSFHLKMLNESFQINQFFYTFHAFLTCHEETGSSAYQFKGIRTDERSRP